MRVNIYAEEMTDRVEIITKEIDGHKFTAVRFYLELPCTIVDSVTPARSRVRDERLAEIVSDDTVKFFGIGHEEVRAIGSELQFQRQLLKRMAEALEAARASIDRNSYLSGQGLRSQLDAVLAEYREAVK